MRLDPKILSLLLVVGCGGGGSDQSTMPTEPMEPAEGAEEAATETPAAETPVETPTEPAAPVIPDAPTAGPDIYKVVFENDKVRAFEVTFAPGAKIAMHQHPDYAVVALTGGTLTVSPKDAEAKDIPLKAGEGGFFPAEMHSAENKTDKEIKAVLVEIKPGAQFTAAPKGADPLVAGKKVYKKVFEDDHVRILSVDFKKGSSVKPHTHPDHVAYVTGAGAIKMTPGEKGAAPVDMALEVGQAMMLDAGIHSAKWAKGEPKAYIFEFKGGASAAPEAPAAEPTK